MRRPLVASAALALLVALLQQLGCSAVRTLNQQPGGSGPNPSTSGKPNFVVILTDDQDLMLNSTHPHYMPALNRLIADKGITFNQFYASSPECCPSRVNLWVGRYAHNTNITTNKGPHGAYGAACRGSRVDTAKRPTALESLCSSAPNRCARPWRPVFRPRIRQKEAKMSG